MLSVAAALDAFATDVAAVRVQRDLIEAVGPDAAGYLQGQLSQNVEIMAAGESRWSLLLQPQGKVEAWLRVHRLGPHRFWLIVDPGWGTAALDRLQRFRLRVDVELELSTRDAVAVRGPGSAKALVRLDCDTGAHSFPNRTEESSIEPFGNTCVAVAAGWPGVEGYDLFGPVEIAGGSTTVGEAPSDALEVLRVMAGVPAMGSELDTSTIPGAAGVVAASVDFNKGCYVGQELVARIDSRGGNTPTKLVKLTSLTSVESGPVVVGAEILRDGEPVGTVTSVAPVMDRSTHALGYLKRAVDLPASLEIQSDGRSLPVEAVPVEVGR